MKKYLGITCLVLFVILVSILAIFFHKTILNFLIDIDVSRFDFLFIYLLICVIYFLLPLPVSFIILLNGYLFNDVGFYISFSIIIFSSTILFFFSRTISNFFDLNITAFFLKKNIKIEKITSNSLSIFRN